MYIAKTGEVNLLNAKNNNEAWEEIVSRSANANGSNEYSQYMSTSRSYALTVNEYIMVKASITKLAIRVDNKLIDYLNAKGYKINTSTDEAYVESLNKASNKCENLRTRISMRKNELDRLTKTGGKMEERSLEQVLANLSYQIGFPVSDEITLARFNEYAKILRLKAEQDKNQHG